MNTLYIRLPAGPGEGWQVALQDAAALGRVSRLPDCHDGNELSALASAHSHDRVIAFAPTADSLFTSVTISARQLKQAGSALAYLIEEQVGEDVDDLHVIQAPQDDDETVPLLVVADEQMTAWLDPLKHAGLRPQALIPDVMLLPLSQEPETGAPWSLALSGQQACLRTGLYHGAAIELDSTEMLLGAALAEMPVTDLRLSVYGGTDGDLGRVNAWASAQSAQGVATTLMVHPEQDWSSAAGRQDAGYWQRHAFNLLQGAYAPRGQGSVPPAWKWAALFLVGAFVIQLGSEWVHYFYYHSKALKTQVAATQFYKQTFPQEHRIVNLRRQMEAHLQGSGQQTNLTVLLTQFGQSLQGSGIQTQRLDFDADSKALSVDVDAKNVGQLESLKQKLQGQGLQMDIISANAQGDGVRGRLKITAGAA